MKAIVFFLLYLFFVLQVNLSDAAVIPQSNWTLKYVDSAEIVGENGAGRNAFDGNSATLWHTEWLNSSPTTPHEIQIDLGLNYDVSGFSCLPRQDGGTNGRIGQYEFYVSSDGLNWDIPVASGTFINSATVKEVLFAKKTGRYVRLRALTEVNGKPWTSLAELNVIGDLTGASPVIPKSGWTITYVDSQELVGENGAAINILDGKSGTLWHTQWLNASPPPPHELRIDLGLVYSIDSFSYLPRQDGSANGRIGQYEFYVSSDGVIWGTPVVTGVFANSATEKFVPFSATSGRFIKLRALSEVNGKAWTSMAELNVTGRISGTQPPDGTITSPSTVTITAGDSVTFSGTGSDPSGNLPLGYFWHFGAGSGVSDSTDKDPGMVIFNAPGVYTVTFTVTNSKGVADPTPASIVVTVKSASPLIPKIGWSVKCVDSQELVGENGAAVNALDGNTTTMWHTQWLNGSPPLPHEVQIDLGLVYTIDSFRYLPRQDGGTHGRIGQYEFYVSGDGVTWGNPVASGSFENNATEKEVAFPATNGRFIRLKALTEANGYTWTSMAELNVLGQLFSESQAPNSTITTPADNVIISVGQAVTFAGSGSDPNGYLPLTYHWIFGSGSGLADSFTKNPGSLSFAIPGTYSVTLSATNSVGVTDPTPASVGVRVEERINPYVTDFFTNALGVGTPAGWTERWVSGNTSYAIQNSTAFPGLRELYYVTNAFDNPVTEGGARRMLSFNAADNLDANTEILVLFEPHINGVIHTDTRAYLRASGVQGNETAYFFTELDTSPTMSRIYKYVNGVMTSSIGPDQVEVLLQNGRKYWERFRANGTQLSAKLWPYGGIEPTEWDVKATDSSITAAGWSGIGIFPKNDYGKFFQVAVADHGATAVPVTFGVTTVPFALSNMDAESGDTSGWTNEFGTMVVDKSMMRNGTSCFAGNAANWRAYRRVNLPAAGVTQARITKGSYISFSVWQRAYAATNDPGRIGIRFLTAAKSEIATIYAPWDSTSVAYTRKHLVEQIPANAAYVDLVLEGQYVSGSTTGAYFDDMEAGYSFEQ